MRNTQPIYRRGGEGGYHRLITRGNAERVAGSVQVPITTGLEPDADVFDNTAEPFYHARDNKNLFG